MATTPGRLFWGESATEAHAVNHPITNINMKTPKKNVNDDESAVPNANLTTKARRLNNNMNATDIPVNMAKKLSNNRSDGCRANVFSQIKK